MVTTTCREVHNLLELFFDSELDPRQMRAVALHSATCPHCEEELRQLERLQDVVVRGLNDRVDEVDLGMVWSGIERRIQPRRLTWLKRLNLWWADQEWGWRYPAFGAAVAAAAIAIFTLAQSQPVRRTIETALSEDGVSVHEISSDSHVALLGETDTLLLWVDHELAGEAPGETSMDAIEPANIEAVEATE